MPLREHLAELRRRLFVCGLAILAGSVGGWFAYGRLFDALQRPLLDVGRDRGINANINFSELSSAFNLQLKLSVYLGLVIASPVWLYQLWAFVVPGLTRREKRYALGFVAAAVPLFLSGIALAWLILPNAVTFFADFVPEGSSIFTSADTYFTFVTRLMLSFAVAFVVPLLLVALNLAHVLPSRTLVRGWRVAVFLCFLFAAIASPTPDAGTMLMLAFPMVALYLGAIGVAVLVDRRREKTRAADPLAQVGDDEASPL
ncbi:MAG: twin-arginine translocase subunit TatC [Kineosporiaceae bacterium]